MTLGTFIFLHFTLVSLFWGHFNETIIPLVLIGYEVMLANSCPTHAQVIKTLKAVKTLELHYPIIQFSIYDNKSLSVKVQ